MMRGVYFKLQAESASLYIQRFVTFTTALTYAVGTEPCEPRLRRKHRGKVVTGVRSGIDHNSKDLSLTSIGDHRHQTTAQNRKRRLVASGGKTRNSPARVVNSCTVRLWIIYFVWLADARPSWVASGFVNVSGKGCRIFPLAFHVACNEE